MAYVITGGNEIGLWPEKMREYWFKNETDSLWRFDEKLFLNHDVPQHRNAETYHGNAPQVIFVARTTTAK